MNPDDAEEFTDALGQIVVGAVRLADWAPKVGIPEALGMTHQEWAQRRLTGRVRLSKDERRQVVDANPDLSTRQLAEALGVDNKTIQNDRHRHDPPVENSTPASVPPVENSTPGGDAQDYVDAMRNLAPEDDEPERRLGFLLSSASDEWATPQDFYDDVHAEFAPTLDVCALPPSAKCDRYYTPDDDGLAQEWTGVCWMNPPYGGEISRWVEKAHESADAGATVVCLLPARVETNWWWDHCRFGEIRFIRGRLKFGGADTSAPFPSALVIFAPNIRPQVRWWER